MLCRTAARASDVAFRRSAEVPGVVAGATQARCRDHPASACLTPLPYVRKPRRAAKQTKKMIRTREKANETSWPSHDRALVIELRTAERRRDPFDDSAAARLLENSDTVIGVPPSAGGKNYLRPIVLGVVLCCNTQVQLVLA